MKISTYLNDKSMFLIQLTKIRMNKGTKFSKTFYPVTSLLVNLIHNAQNEQVHPNIRSIGNENWTKIQNDKHWLLTSSFANKTFMISHLNHLQEDFDLKNHKFLIREIFLNQIKNSLTIGQITVLFHQSQNLLSCQIKIGKIYFRVHEI